MLRSTQITLLGFLNLRISLTIVLLTFALWNSQLTSVNGAPAKIESNETPFLLEPAIGDDQDKAFGKQSTALDSYGNPIESLKPINTPDGRKVVSAEGLQFEIPSYASGITEIRPPADDLLPPFIGELSKSKNKSVQKVLATKEHVEKSNVQLNSKERANQPKLQTAHAKRILFESNAPPPPYNKVVRAIANSSKSFQNSQQSTFSYNPPLLFNTPQVLNSPQLKTAPNFTKTRSFTIAQNSPNPSQHLRHAPNSPHLPTFSLPNSEIYFNPYTSTFSGHSPKSIQRYLRPTSPYYPTSNSYYISEIPAFLTTPPARFYARAPLSNGNFNYPNIPNDLVTVNRIASKYHQPTIPTPLDTIAVALPDDENVMELSTSTNNPLEQTTTSSADIDVEHAEIVELPNEEQKLLAQHAEVVQQDTEVENTGNRQTQEESAQAPSIVATDAEKGDETGADRLPDYLLDLNDPDVGGPVDYTPPDEGRALKVLAWDLLPPIDTEPVIVTQENNAQARNNGGNNQRERFAQTTETQAVDGNDSTDTRYTTNTDLGQRPFRGKVHFTSTTTRSPNPRISTTRRAFVAAVQTTSSTTSTTTYRPTTTTRRTTFSTRAPTTTTRSTTTTTRPTTTRTTTTRSTTAAPLPLTTEAVDTSDYYRLEKGDSYTLPPWLADFEDPDLDAAVEFVIPDDLNAYNHTVATDIEPPLEPFTDLSVISLPAPTGEATPRSTTVRPTTTLTPATTSTKLPSSSKSFNPNRFTNSNHFALSPQSAHDQAASFSSIVSTKQSTKVPLSNSSSTSSPSTTTTSRPTTARTVFTTTTAAPTTKTQEQTINNRNFATSTADLPNNNNVDISSGIAPRPVNPLNPFLQPKPFSRNAAPTTTTTTSTTTTTTTAAPIIEDENPFDTATLPSWLDGLDYPDLAPGVPFIYDPKETETLVANDLEPPAQPESNSTASSTAAANKPVFITSPTASLNKFLPKTPAESSTSTFPNANFKKTSASTSSPTATSPSLSINQSNQHQVKKAPVTRPPIVFIPPPPVPADGGEVKTTVVQYETPNKQSTSPNLNKNFVAPFDQPSEGQGDVPDEEAGSFPPFEGKTKFTKSDDGKVISHSVLATTANGATGGSAAAAVQGNGKPFGFGNNFATPQKDFQATQTNQFFSGPNGLNGFNTAQTSTSASRYGSSSSRTSSSSVTTSSVTQQSQNFGATGATGFTKSTFTVAGGAGKYTGSFGGAPGVLGSGRIGYAVQADGSIRDPEQQYRPTEVKASNTRGVAADATPVIPTNPAVAASTKYNTYSSRAASSGSYQNRFGGPPGVLIPYDNVRG